ncbi:MAG: GumC family protein [Candidatus Hodarchaeota archaeon]
MERQLSVQDYVEMALRRKWWIIIPFVVCIGLSFGVYKKLPKIYRATTTILVVPPEVPENYIAPTVKSTASEGLNTLRQQILSRTRLENVIRELNLYSDMTNKKTMEEIVEVMKKAIYIEVQRVAGPDTFAISYFGRDPRTVMLVTNRLASLFIEENLTAREKQAATTSIFLERELFSVEAKLKNKESQIRTIKESYMGELPEQLSVNLSILKSLQDQLESVNQRIKLTEEMRLMLQNQLSQLSTLGTDVVASNVGSESVEESYLDSRLTQLKEELSQLLSVYTAKHPDVIALRDRIARLEKDTAPQEGNNILLQGDVNASSGPEVNPPILNPFSIQLEEQINQMGAEIAKLKAERESLDKKVALYQNRVENTPKREQELAGLTRDLKLLQDYYTSLRNKLFQAKMAENLERRQKGEQFKILDHARMPEKPFKPNPKKIMLVGVLLGLVLGGGLGYMKETMDRSFHKIEEIEDFLELPVIATIPRIETKKREKRAA